MWILLPYQCSGRECCSRTISLALNNEFPINCLFRQVKGTNGCHVNCFGMILSISTRSKPFIQSCKSFWTQCKFKINFCEFDKYGVKTIYTTWSQPYLYFGLILILKPLQNFYCPSCIFPWFAMTSFLRRLIEIYANLHINFDKEEFELNYKIILRE